MRLSKQLSILPVLLVVLGTCRTPITYTRSIQPDRTFSRQSISATERRKFSAAAHYSRTVGGAALLVLREGRIIYETYHNGYDAARPVHIFSGTKTFAGVLALAAVADGKLSLDEPVSRTLPDFGRDPCRARIRVRHLLEFTSGIDQSFWRLSRDGMVVPAQQRIHNKYNYARGLDCTGKAGDRFQYGSSHLMIFGALLRRKLGRDPLAYLKQRVLDPIGFRHAGWHRDPAGNAMLAYGAWTTAREWAKFGELLLARGSFRGRQIIPRPLFERLLHGSSAMPAYGLTLWLNRPVAASQRRRLIPQLRRNARQGAVLLPGGPLDLYAAAGYNGNRLYVLPSRKMVIVRLGLRNSFRDAKFLKHIMN